MMARVEDKHFWFIGKRFFINQILSDLVKKDAKILDLGSGTGGLTKHLTRFGNVTGIEKSRYSANLARKRGLKVLISSVDRIPFKKPKFDLITIFDVLYHKNISDERTVIKNAFKVLKREGYLLITDSAFPFLAGNHDIATQGKARYTKSDMEKIILSQNFKIVRSSYIFMSLFPVVLLKRRILDNLFKSETSDVFETNKIINTIFLWIINLEAYLFKYINFPFGTSVIVLAQKN